MKTMVFGGLLLALLAGCAGTQNAGAPSASKDGTAAPDLHSSQNALDWAGVYEGVLPCADCPGSIPRKNR